MFSHLNLASALSPEALELIILPTEKCNFRCTYCYEDFKIGKMKPPTIRGIKNLISNRAPQIKHLTLSWFGGEPLLAKDVILDIAKHAQATCEKFGISLQAGFTTNGYLLTPSLMETLSSLSHSRYQITLDGDAEWHDRTRLLANRRGTFEVIWSNLIAYKNLQHDFAITLRLHVHRKNIESVKRLYHMVSQELIEDKRFSTYFHRVSDLGGDTVDRASVLNRSDYLSALEFITDGAQSNGERPASEMHLDGYICYAAKPNSIMVRANGGIGKCTVALNDDRNAIGRINEDGTLEISNTKLQKWFHGYADLSEKSLGCPLSTLPH